MGRSVRIGLIGVLLASAGGGLWWVFARPAPEESDRAVQVDVVQVFHSEEGDVGVPGVGLSVTGLDRAAWEGWPEGARGGIELETPAPDTARTEGQEGFRIRFAVEIAGESGGRGRGLVEGTLSWSHGGETGAADVVRRRWADTVAAGILRCVRETR